jgi:predicted ATP-dependent endonuclease of OLD family
VIIASSIVLSAMRKTILVIDEPELHLHPSAQKRLAKLLSQEATNKQIVIITHSPYFIFWEHLKNGAKFLRFNKYNQVCTVHELNHNNLEKIKGYNEPTRYHLFDIAAKEIMFIDKILFVEGQEDTGIIYKWAQEEKRELNFNIFGYGTNGWSNFYIFLEISKQLGIKKVAVLYDKSKPNDTNPERGNIHLDDDLEQNRKEYKDYRFYQLETTDIIGKKDGKVNKEGIFDETGNLRKECSAHFEKIISDLNEYFSQ